MSDTRERMESAFGSVTSKDLLDAMREVARDLGERVGALERRVTALEYVLRHLCWDNRHMLVGGEGWARRNLDTIDKAQDHGGTEAAGNTNRRATSENGIPPAGAASVQPAPAPEPECNCGGGPFHGPGCPANPVTATRAQLEREAGERMVRRFAEWIMHRGCSILTYQHGTLLSSESIHDAVRCFLKEGA